MKSHTKPGVLVGYCHECRVVFDPYRHGETCAYSGCHRKVRKRRMYFCEVCGGYYPTAKALEEHEHYDWE